MDTWAAVVQFASNVYDALASGCCPSVDNSAEEVVSWIDAETPRVLSQLGDPSVDNSAEEAVSWIDAETPRVQSQLDDPSVDNSAEEVVSWIDAETPRVQSQLGDVAICTPRKLTVLQRMASTPSTVCPGTDEDPDDVSLPEVMLKDVAQFLTVFDFASLRAVDRRADVSMDFAAHIMSIFQPEKIEKIIDFENYVRDPALISDASQIGMNVLLCHFGLWFLQSPNTVLQLVQALQKHCADTATDDVGHSASTFVMANFAAVAVSSGVKELRHIFIRFLIQWLRTDDREQLYYACAALVHCHDLGPFREECKQALMMAQTDEDQCRLRALAAVCPEIWGTADRRIRHLSSVCPDLSIRPYLLPLQSSYWVYTGERWAFDRTWSRRCVRQVQQ